jgi:hypothetical protein
MTPVNPPESIDSVKRKKLFVELMNKLMIEIDEENIIISSERKVKILNLSEIVHGAKSYSNYKNKNGNCYVEFIYIFFPSFI